MYKNIDVEVMVKLIFSREMLSLVTKGYDKARKDLVNNMVTALHYYRETV